MSTYTPSYEVLPALKWRLPAGVEVLLPHQAEQVELLRRTLLDLFRGWGYELISPPLIDSLEALKVGAGQDLEQQIFVLSDVANGELLGLRPDITPQVARIDAHSLAQSTVTRLCYSDAVLQARPSRVSDQRMLIQTGVELYGHHGVASDVEMLQLLMATLDELAIDDYHLDVGHVGILDAILAGCDSGDLKATQKSQLLQIIQRKSMPDLKVYLLQQGWSDQVVGKQLCALLRFHGRADVLALAKQALADISPLNPALMAAFDELEAVSQCLIDSLPEERLIFDLSESRGFQYHTGLVFAAYVPSFGAALAMGGRYNGVGREFGNARPAIGFSLDLLKAASVSGRQVVKNMAIYAPAELVTSALSLISDLRLAGERVILGLSDDEVPDALGCDRQIIKNTDGQYQVTWLAE